MTVAEAKAKMTEARRARLDCALNLYTLAQDVLATRSSPRCGRGKNGPGGAPCTTCTAPDCEIRLEVLCTAGAIAESYVANMAAMNELLRCRDDRIFVTAKETVAAWEEQYDWIVRNGLRPPIVHFNGIRQEPLPFSVIHKSVLEAYANVQDYRKQLNKERNH